MRKKFPENFYWGAATSSHQVEGGNVNDWSEWEKTNAKRLSEEAKKRWPDWQKEKFPEMFQEKNYISGRACDHYNLFEKDFEIAKSLGHNAHRFSIEWSRIEPEEGKFNEEAIEHYRQVIQSLKSRNIEPFVTLWHWTLPIWMRDLGGVKSKKFPKYFSRYVEKMAQVFGQDVKFWITLNEPNIYTGQSYVIGCWPPQKNNVVFYYQVIKNLIKAHKQSFNIIKNINPQAQVGIAQSYNFFEFLGGKIINKIVGKVVGYVWSLYFLDRTKKQQDFIGLNNYYRKTVGFKSKKTDNKFSNLSWEIFPEAIYHCLMDLKKYQKPIYITENGLADVEDKYRAEFIKSYLTNVQRAIQEGVDVRGYFYWSLLDNFEWDKGFWPRFGLVEVNYQTLERKIRPSAWEYKKIIENNSLD
ncbi:MAG: glycoside hydrolase family 1 protein [Candidatus Moranbacteria bacterium CG10_big_fil_rev_8_21_14_0_10_35_21]|nr:MAG: glycoside hydrolase family 1 protein [Candidatus Moranbacteria bacterium CG10_big_fil_rev_8_21_14_0_10_35_21]PJA88338.1 MAG: glycoside hydrolase family 1 protein [Candidatus Moranbacteria bacterium CG_4_9_14_3_um_filter_36_9]